MHPRAIRQKHREANEEASELASSIAKKTGVDAEVLNTSHPEPAMNAMYQAEALRDFLKELDAYLGDGPAATDLESIEEIGSELAEKLREVGVQTLEDLRGANDADLLKIDGIGKATLKKIKEQL